MNKVWVARDYHYPKQTDHFCDTLYYSESNQDFLLVPFEEKKSGYKKLSSMIGRRMVLFFVSNLAIFFIIDTLGRFLLREYIGGGVDTVFSVIVRVVAWIYIAFFVVTFRRIRIQKFARRLWKPQMLVAVNRALKALLEQEDSEELYKNLLLLHRLYPTGINNERRASYLLRTASIDFNWHGETDSLLLGNQADYRNRNVLEYLNRVYKIAPYTLGVNSRSFLKHSNKFRQQSK